MLLRVLRNETIVDVLVYVGLLIGALIFCGGTFLEYFDEKTQYDHQTEPISFQDLPTLTVCIAYSKRRLEYGKDISIEADLFETSIPLLENKQVQALHGISLHLSEFFMASYEAHPLRARRQCFKISPHFDGNYEKRTTDFEKFVARFGFLFPNETAFPRDGQATVTSEDDR